MTNPNDPVQHDPCRDDGNGCGLTKREFFVAMAMQGILSTRNHSVYYVDRQSDQDIIAADTRNAIRIADALIAALNEEPKP